MFYTPTRAIGKELLTARAASEAETIGVRQATRQLRHIRVFPICS